MALFPIYGLFEGDFVPHLVAIDTEQSMAEVAGAVAVHSVGRRLPEQDRPLEAEVAGLVVPLTTRFADVAAERGVQPLDFVRVRYAS